MADTLTFELVSPAKKLASTDAEAVTIPGMEGDLTAMVNHAPFLTTLRPGFVVIRNGTSEERYFVTGGFAEISENTVSVLAEQAAEQASVDQGYLDERLAEAEQALEEASDDRKQAARQRVDDLTALKSLI